MKHTSESFILAATERHGDKYSYAKVRYRGAHAKVTIICPEHGEFEQLATNHLSGYGCAACSGVVRKTTKSWIAEARQVHGKKYQYTNSVYTSANDYITITCRQHGEFLQRASSHLTGSGCPECAVQDSTVIKTTTADFIAKAQKTHGNTYSYRKSVYTGAKDTITITCKTHGDFEQLAARHTRGAGCAKCAQVRRSHKLTLADFPPDTVLVTKQQEFAPTEVVSFICTTHGKRTDTARKLSSRKNSCQECARAKAAEKIRKPFKQFVKQATKIHRGKYQYGRYETKPVLKIVAVCPIHGEFKQRVQAHLAGGCLDCGRLQQLKSGYTAKEYRLGKRTVRIQGYEAYALDDLRKTTKLSDIRLGEEIPVFEYIDPSTKRLRKYYPDIFVRPGTIVEVKSLYYFLLHGKRTFYENAAKAKAVIEAGFSFKLMVFNRGGTRVYVPKNWHTQPYTKMKAILSK